MTTQTLPHSTGAAYTITLDSLANVTYVASSAVDLSATDPVDVLVEVEVTPGTVSGNKQLKVFVQASLDGTDYSTGPTSGTTTTDELNLYFLGSLPLNTNATLQRKAFSMVEKIGFVPAKHTLVVFNDSGAALASSGNAAAYYTVTGNSA